MKVLRLYGAGDLRLEQSDPPLPAPGEAVVRVTAVGICGSDLHWYAESRVGDALLDRPLVLGHEAAGVIESGPRTGERVALDPSIPCLACEPCREGRGHLCLAVRFAGNGPTDGTLRESVAWPEHCLVPVPPSLTDAEVALLEPLGVALHAVGLGGLRPGSSVGVFGCGPIGLMIVQLARTAGATTIVATDRLEHRLEAARRAGADVAVPVSGGTEREELRRATGGRGVDVAFEVAGEDDAVETAIALARPAATVVLVGIPGTDTTTFTASTARHKGLTLKLSRRMNRTYPRAIRLVESGSVDLRPLVTADLPLAAFDSAFRIAARREGLKVVIRPSESPDASRR